MKQNNISKFNIAKWKSTVVRAHVTAFFNSWIRLTSQLIRNGELTGVTAHSDTRSLHWSDTFAGARSLTLGAHAQRGLQYSVCVSLCVCCVCVCVCVCV